MLAVRKVEQIREDLGKVGPVIASQVTEAMLGQRTRLQTMDAEKAAEPVRRMFKFERDLETRIQRIHEQLQESRRELALTPENIGDVVTVALALAGQPALQEAELPGIWPDPKGRRHRCPVFHVPPLRGPSWSQCAEGLAHPHTGEIRPIVFDHNLARGRDDVVLAHLNHRLVQMCLRLLRAEVWSGRGRSKLHRVTVRTVPDHILRHPAMIAHARLVVIGGDSRRLHEEIIYAGGQIRAQRFRRFDTLHEMNDILSHATDDEASGPVKAQLQRLWPYIEPALTRALEVRRDERFASLLRHLERREQKDLDDIRAVLDELARAIHDELDDQPAQLSLFDADERDQYMRNVNALQTRLEQIPHELEAEQTTIRQRYADPQARMFPICVTFLIPKRLAQ